MRSVFRLLNAGAKLMEIYTKMLAKYGTPRVSKTQVYEWVQKCKNEVQMVEGPPRAATVADTFQHEDSCKVFCYQYLPSFVRFCRDFA
jgi:hypothetical protein